MLSSKNSDAQSTVDQIKRGHNKRCCSQRRHNAPRRHGVSLLVEKSMTHNAVTSTSPRHQSGGVGWAGNDQNKRYAPDRRAILWIEPCLMVDLSWTYTALNICDHSFQALLPLESFSDARKGHWSRYKSRYWHVPHSVSSLSIFRLESNYEEKSSQFSKPLFSDLSTLIVTFAAQLLRTLRWACHLLTQLWLVPNGLLRHLYEPFRFILVHKKNSWCTGVATFHINDYRHAGKRRQAHPSALSTLEDGNAFIASHKFIVRWRADKPLLINSQVPVFLSRVVVYFAAQGVKNFATLLVLALVSSTRCRPTEYPGTREHTYPSNVSRCLPRRTGPSATIAIPSIGCHCASR